MEHGANPASSHPGIDLLLSLFGGLSIWGLVSVILAVGGGWLGGKLAGR